VIDRRASVTAGHDHCRSPHGMQALRQFSPRPVGAALIDLHGGEFTQQLTAHVAIPWLADDDLWRRSLEIACAFNVGFVSQRDLRGTPLILPRLLLEAGVPNVWTEIGHNGLPHETAISLQYRGLVNALRIIGALPGKPVRHTPRLVGPRHWNIVGTERGMWRPAVRAGQQVQAGQLLGELFDVFGVPLRDYRSPGDGRVMWVCTSPPVEPDKQPHGNNWHQWLASVAEESSE